MTGFATGMVAGALWLVFFVALGLTARKSPGHPFKSIRRFRTAGRTLQMDVPSALKSSEVDRLEEDRGMHSEPIPERTRLRPVPDLAPEAERATAGAAPAASGLPSEGGGYVEDSLHNGRERLAERELPKEQLADWNTPSQPALQPESGWSRLESPKSENIDKRGKKERKAKADKSANEARKSEARPKSTREPEVEESKQERQERLSRAERRAQRKEAEALKAIQANRELTGPLGGPPIRRPLNDPGRLNVPTQAPLAPSMAEWSRAFQPPAAWTQPIATTYVQKRAMLAAMKGAKGDSKDEAPQQQTTPKAGSAPRPVAPAPNPFIPRFGTARVVEEPPPPPPPVFRSTPSWSGDLSRPRLSGAYSYSPPAAKKPEYPTVSTSRADTGWSPSVRVPELNPYFNKYAKRPEPEEKAVPYWQRRLDNPTASQQIRMIAQNWIVARSPQPADPSPAEQEMTDGSIEQPVMVDPPMAAAPTTIWLPKLPTLPPPGEVAAKKKAAEAEAAEGEPGVPPAESEIVDLTSFQSSREPAEGAARSPADHAFPEDSYSSADRWTSLKDFDRQAESLSEPEAPREKSSDDDLDWESMVRKPKMSRRKRRKAARADWEPPAAELEFRDAQSPELPGEVPAPQHDDEPELRGRRRRFRAADMEEELPPRRQPRAVEREAQPDAEYRPREAAYREPDPEPQYRERERAYREPEPEYRPHEPRQRGREPRYREPEPEYREPEPEYRQPKPEYREPEPEFRESEPEYREPDPDYREPAAAYREGEREPAPQPSEPRSRRRSRRSREEPVFEQPGRTAPERRPDPRLPDPELVEVVPRPRPRRVPAEETQLVDLPQYEPVNGEAPPPPPPAARRSEPARPPRARVKAPRHATMVEDGLVYVLVDDEGRAVLK